MIKETGGTMKKKILFIGLGERYGGVEQFTFSLCDSILRNYYEFDFLSYNHPDRQTKEYIDKLCGRTYNITRYSKNFLQFLSEIYYFFRMNKDYDFIYCNASHASTIMYIMPVWMKRTPKVIFHSHASNGNHKSLHKLLRILVNWRCNMRIACSEKAAIWMYGTTKDIQIIYNGIETKKYRFNADVRRKLREQYQIKDEKVIGYFSRFVPGKNHQFLIDVFKEVLKKSKDVKLLLIGDGELKETIITQLEREQLVENAILLPFQKQIQDFYNMLDVFVFPSENEGFGLIGIEAQANGLPIVMSDTLPKAVACTPLAIFQNLSDPTDIWAERILSTKENVEREKCWKFVEQAGFDQREMINKIFILLQKL